VTFDLVRPTSLELNRLRGAFERFGWERLGNTAYRYPALDAVQQTEDWFNHVIPALMMLRCFACSLAASGRGLRAFSIDVQSSTGFNPLTGAGVLPQLGHAATSGRPSNSGRALGRNRLEEWLDEIEWPYPPPAAGTGT
jgi:hypothetical protein